MNDRHFLRELRLFSEAADIGVENFDAVLKIRVISSFDQVDKNVVYDDLVQALRQDDSREDNVNFPVCMEWDKLSRFLTRDQYANCYVMISFWLKLFSYVDFIDEPGVSTEIEQYMKKVRLGMTTPNPGTFTAIDAVRIAVFRVCRGNAPWSVICKTYLLMNIVRDDPTAAVTGLLREAKLVQDDGTGRSGMEVARYLMGLRSPVQEHQMTLATLLSTYMQINHQALQALLRVEQENEDGITDGVRTLFLQRMRPSLSDMAARQTVALAGYGSMSFAEEENFVSFCRGCRFPINMSNSMQRYVYFLKCISDPGRGIDTDAHIKLCIACPVILSNVNRMSVVLVECPVIVSLISIVQNIGEPSVMLKKFRSECMDPFLGSRRARDSVNWTTVLKLYLAAYQREKFRGECWNAIVRKHQSSLGWDAGSTSETRQAVDKFVDAEPFDTGYALGMVDRAVRTSEGQRI